METYYLILIEGVKGSLAAMLSVLILIVSGYFTVKTIRIFIALFNYAITEPEVKIVKKVHKLKKRA
jgi:hypothetical protein